MSKCVTHSMPTNVRDVSPPPTKYRRHRMNEMYPRQTAALDSMCYELYATRITVAPPLIYKLHAAGELAFGSRKWKKEKKELGRSMFAQLDCQNEIAQLEYNRLHRHQNTCAHSDRSFVCLFLHRSDALTQYVSHWVYYSSRDATFSEWIFWVSNFRVGS